MKNFFYKYTKDEASGVTDIRIDESYVVDIWQPGMRRKTDFLFSVGTFYIWIVFHYLRIFESREYSILTISHKKKIIHRSVVFPKYFRFPFMTSDDLQIGDTWTDPMYRNRGLATFALQTIIQYFEKKGRYFWYIFDIENGSSKRVIEKAGFQKFGIGERTSRFGLRLLGAFIIKEHI